MVIKSAQYNLNEAKDGNGSVITAIIDDIELQVPTNPDNRHYAAILKWVADGNTIKEAE